MRVASTLFASLALTGCLIPRTPFSESTPPPAPTYTDEAAWAALPWRDDNADLGAAGETDGQAEATVDVFFIHPTTYFSGKSWNQPIDDESTNERTDDNVLPNQASVFNGHARVFAPRYRQATLGSYLGDDQDSRDAALDLAYGDVLAAFEHYLAAWGDGRPIVIAGHSQGAQHAYRLLSERFAHGDLRDRLVAGYVVGALVPTDVLADALPGLLPCSDRDEAGCWIVYNSVKANEAPSRFDQVRAWTPSGPTTFAMPTLTCTNPVTGAVGTAWSERSAHGGAARLSSEGDGAPVHRSALSTRCTERGLLEVDIYDDEVSVRGDDLHIYDYSLFRSDLRRDLAARVAAFVR